MQSLITLRPRRSFPDSVHSNPNIGSAFVRKEINKMQAKEGREKKKFRNWSIFYLTTRIMIGICLIIVPALCRRLWMFDVVSILSVKLQTSVSIMRRERQYVVIVVLAIFPFHLCWWRCFGSVVSASEYIQKVPCLHRWAEDRRSFTALTVC